MSAQLKIFVDKECTQELPLSTANNPLLFLGTKKGINGNTGEVWRSSVYVKNVGTRAALHTKIFLQGVKHGQDYLTIEEPFIGDLKELEVREVKMIVYVPRWTPATDCNFQLVFDYYTLPEIDETFHNPYTDIREVAV